MTAVSRPLAFAAARLEAAVTRLDAIAATAPQEEFDRVYAEYAVEVRRFAGTLREVTGMPLSLLDKLETS